MFDQYLMGINDVVPLKATTFGLPFRHVPTYLAGYYKYKAGDQEYDIIIKDKRLAEKKEEENQDPVRTLEDLPICKSPTRIIPLPNYVASVISTLPGDKET